MHSPVTTFAHFSYRNRKRPPDERRFPCCGKQASKTRGVAYDTAMLWAVSCTCFFGFLLFVIRCMCSHRKYIAMNVWQGKQNDEVCPVGALLGYIAHRDLAPGPLFHFQDGRYLTRDLLVREIRLALGSVGIDVSAYSGHSFRIGAATSAASAGVEDALIQTLGRWKSTAYLQYIKLPRDSLAGISTILANQK